MESAPMESQGKDSSSHCSNNSTAAGNPEAFESRFVHRFYSTKAKEFSGTRRKPWPFTLEFFKKYVNESDMVLDSGCGNGRQFISTNTIGLDYSAELLRQASRHSPLSLVRADVHELPFRDNTFDVILSIAVLHHLSTAERRLDAMKEMFRAVKPSGHCLIYLWHKSAAAQKKFNSIHRDEYLVSWGGDKSLARYYILFDELGLKELCESAGFEVLETNTERESVYAVVKKGV